ncbi:MAG: amidase [Rhodospirillales bacterium]
MTDLALRSATDLAADIKARKLGCLELLEACLARLERFNPSLNAVIWQDLEQARARARAADEALARGEDWGPLMGLPTTIKESYNFAGAPTTWGVPEMKDNIADSHAVATQRLLDAGAVIYGKTNVPLLLSDWQSFNEIYGTTNNPWDQSKTPGGSSGGSAVSLATGMAAVEIGSDIGASIRNPAHYCGVCGHKPTHAIVPLRGHATGATLAHPDISVGGPLARSVADLEQSLAVLAGPDVVEAAGLTLTLPPPHARTLKDFRVAVMVDDACVATDRAYQQTILDLAKEVERAGAKVSYTARPEIDSKRAFWVYIRLLRSLTMARVGAEERARWEARAAALSDDDHSRKAEIARAAVLSHKDWLEVHEEREQHRWAWHRFFQDWDVLLAPVGAGPAFPHDQTGERVDRTIEINGKAENTTDQLFWAGLFGVVSLPSTVCPLPLHPSGLPLGLQIVGPQYGDLTTLAFGKLVEEVTGGYRPPPGYES